MNWASQRASTSLLAYGNVNSLATDSQTPSTLYAATSAGLFAITLGAETFRTDR